MQIKIPNDIDTSYFDESQGRTLSIYLNPETGELWDRVSVGNGGVPECVWHQRHLHIYSTRTHTYGPDTWSDALERVKDEIAGLLDLYHGCDYDSRSNYVGMWDEDIEWNRYKVEEKLEEYLQGCVNETYWQPDEWLQYERNGLDDFDFWLHLCEKAGVNPRADSSVEKVESFLWNGDNVSGLSEYLYNMKSFFEDNATSCCSNDIFGFHCEAVVNMQDCERVQYIAEQDQGTYKTTGVATWRNGHMCEDCTDYLDSPFIR